MDIRFDHHTARFFIGCCLAGMGIVIFTFKAIELAWRARIAKHEIGWVKETQFVSPITREEMPTASKIACREAVLRQLESDMNDATKVFKP